MSSRKVIRGGQLDVLSDLSTRAVNKSDIILDTIDNGGNLIVIYWDHGSNPATLFDGSVTAGETENGDPIVVENWPQALLLLSKTGDGACTITIEGRQKEDGDWNSWWTLVDSEGSDAEYSLSTGSQNLRAKIDLFGYYELRITVEETGSSDSVTVEARISGGL